MTAVRPPHATLRCARCGAPVVTGRGCTACVRRPATPPRPAPRAELDPPTAPMSLPVPIHPATGMWVLAGVLTVLLLVGVLALVRPDLVGLPSVPLFGASDAGPATPGPG